MGLRPVNRIKHVVDQQLALVLAVPQGFNLCLATDTPTLANTTGVETGSIVNGIYLNIEAYATTGAALANIYALVYKNPGGNLNDPAGNAVGGDDNKRFVIHQEMKMLQEVADGNPRTLFNGVIALPKGYRRFGPNDSLRLVLLSPGVNCNVCFQCHYKEFR